MTELEARFADGRVVDDRQKPRRIGHDRPIEQRLVMVEQIDKEDVAVEIGGLVTELHHHPPQLQILGLGNVGHQADEPERLLLGLAKGGGFIQATGPIGPRFRAWPSSCSSLLSWFQIGARGSQRLFRKPSSLQFRSCDVRMDHFRRVDHAVEFGFVTNPSFSAASFKVRSLSIA